MCLFCDILLKREKIIFENDLAFAILDNYPVTKGHALIISKRHFESYFDASVAELVAIDDALKNVKKILDDSIHPDGYNLGVNQGRASGQSVMHLHVHLIPRSFGDTPNPRGGVRGVFPDKQDYDGSGN